MRFFTALTGALLASSVSAFAIGGTSQNPQKALENELSVPGDNPLQYCVKPDDDVLEIKSVDLSPNPPKA